MADLTTFTQTLVQKKKDDVQQQLDQFSRDLLHQKEDTLRTLEMNMNAKKESINKQCQDNYEKTIQTVTNQTRNEILVEKQNQLLALFDDAIMTMNEWSTVQTERFFNAVVTQLPQGQYTVQFGEFTKRPEKLPENMMVVDEKIASEGGFVFEQNGVRYNYLYRTLVDELKRTYMKTIMSKLEEK